MKLNLRTFLCALTAVLFSANGVIQAQTVISGPNIMTSTWSPAGSPYIVTADCTVPSGQTLTIQPGTTVWMGSGTSLTGNGIISAVGTAAQPITFQPPVSSQMWNTIIINNTLGTNQFKHCEFMNATNALDFRSASRNVVASCNFSNIASTGIVFRDNSINTAEFCSFQNSAHGIYLTVRANNRTQTSKIGNCSFTNCSSQAIYGESGGEVVAGQNAWLNLQIVNCHIFVVGGGCRFSLFSLTQAGWSGSRGYANITLLNNIIQGVTNTAVDFIVGAYAGDSAANVINNSIANAGSGVVVRDPWDAKVQNNIFKNCGTGVTRSGSLSATVSFNDLFGNTANFSGYPVTYGQVILANRNGTPCDLLFNIFSDPMFVSSSDFHLQAGSPCIDAGEGSGANFDSYFPPSMGSVTNDIGAYGGPNAGQWIVPAPTNAFSLGITRIPYASVTINPPEPGNYRLEYSSALLGTNTWVQITNLPLTTLPFTYTEPAAVPARYYRAVKQ